MGIYVFSFVVCSLAMLGLGLGVIAGRGTIRGSCGGLNQLGDACESCARPCKKAGAEHGR